MNVNPQMIQFINMMKNGNPEQTMISMLERSAQGNPFMGNLLQMARNRDAAGIENVARNIAKEKGIDYDKEFNSFKQMFRNF